ncbi:MAG: hypoxanthine phosphoribosyltransferase [bacterium]
MHDKIEEILFTEEDIRRRIAELGKEISADYAGKDLVLLAVLRGAVIFLADLARAIDLQLVIDYMVVTRYGRHDHPTDVKILKDMDTSIDGKHVIIVEDIIDNGNTLYFLQNNLKLRNPASLKICTLFNKPAERLVPIEPDYNGFVVPNRFVVGFGLDYQQKYRNLPYLGTIRS